MCNSGLVFRNFGRPEVHRSSSGVLHELLEQKEENKSHVDPWLSLVIKS